MKKELSKCKLLVLWLLQKRRGEVDHLLRILSPMKMKNRKNRLFHRKENIDKGRQKRGIRKKNCNKMEIV